MGALLIVILLIAVAGYVSYTVINKEESKIKLLSVITKVFNIGKDEFELAEEELTASDGLEDIEKDLEKTIVGSPDLDLQQLDTSASSL